MTEQNILETSELKEKANAGEAQAQFDLALCYANGKGVEKNSERAFDWHKKTAKQGYMSAQLAMGLYYLLGVDKQQTEKLINKWVMKQGKEKSVDSTLDLAVTLAIDEKFTKANDKLAFIWFKKAADKHHAESSYWLGQCYQNGWGTEENDTLAFECFKKSAEQEFEVAYYDLALCYQKGKGIEQSDEIAIEWCKKASEQDVSEAQYWLACHYFEDNKGEQNNEVAFSWLRKAANGGHDEAVIDLAGCYEDGVGTDKNNEKAYKCYERASIKDHSESQYWLARYYFHGGIFDQLSDTDKQVLASESNPEYWRNIYFEKGYERAFSWAGKAAVNGGTEAYLLLGFMSTYGLGTEQDSEQAFQYFLMFLMINVSSLAATSFKKRAPVINVRAKYLIDICCSL